MEPIIRGHNMSENEEEAIGFLRESACHFLTTTHYPSDAFPTELAPRVIVLGPNCRAGYAHLPEGAGASLIRAYCQRALQLEPPPEPDLGVFLQSFLSRLKDMDDLSEVARSIIMEISGLFASEGAALLVFDERRGTLRFAASYSQEPGIEEKLKSIEIPLGQGVAGWVAQHGKPLVVDRADNRFSPDIDQQTEFLTRNLMAAPIWAGQKLIGVLEVVNHRSNTFDQHDLPIFGALASVVGIFLEKAQLIQERRRHLVLAGKAEIANSVLHNIGNVLNSFIVSCGLMEERMDPLLLEKLGRIAQLLERAETDPDPVAFLTQDQRGKQIPPFLSELNRLMKQEREGLLQELKKINDKSHLMKDIIETQQAIARTGVTGTQDLIAIIEEALGVMEDVLRTGRIRVVRDYHSDKPIRGQRTKMVHILINLFKNAAEALADQPDERKIIRISTQEQNDGFIQAIVADQGSGIEATVLTQLFAHGFTTKEQGHGFGLNFCAKAMAEMQGRIEAQSDGPGLGARFILSFPGPTRPDLLTP